MASSSSHSPFAVIPPAPSPLHPFPDGSLLQPYCMEGYLLPQNSAALAHAAGASSAPQHCDAPHPQKKFSPGTELRYSRIMGIGHNPDIATGCFPHRHRERPFVIQMIYLTTAVDLPPFLNSLGQNLSLCLHPVYLELYHPP